MVVVVVVVVVLVLKGVLYNVDVLYKLVCMFRACRSMTRKTPCVNADMNLNEQTVQVKNCFPRRYRNLMKLGPNFLF